MSEICIDCVHQEVCRYDCHSPSEHCNDYAVADDFRAQGKWIYHRAQGVFLPYMECDNCHEEFLLNMLRPAEFRKVNRFCSNCGADMRGNK